MTTITQTAAAVAPHVFTTAPKGAKILGGPEEKFAEFAAAKIGGNTKAAKVVRAIIAAGQEGATLQSLSEASGVSIANLSPYPSFDIRRLGVRVVKLQGGRLGILARKGHYTPKAIIEAAGLG